MREFVQQKKKKKKHLIFFKNLIFLFLYYINFNQKNKTKLNEAQE